MFRKLKLLISNDQINQNSHCFSYEGAWWYFSCDHLTLQSSGDLVWQFFPTYSSFLGDTRRGTDFVNYFLIFDRFGKSWIKSLCRKKSSDNCSWFHADISKDEAEKRLLHRPEGTFLVRLSTTTPEYPFTISMINSQHRRISHTPGGVTDSRSWSSHFKALRAEGFVNDIQVTGGFDRKLWRQKTCSSTEICLS